MFHEIYMHVVWTTRDRAPLINLATANYLTSAVPLIASQERATVMEIGIVSTHLHLLMRLHPTTAVPRLLQRLKGATAAGANQRQLTPLPIRWAKGYSIHSVGVRALDAAAAYVRSQPVHHPTEAIEASDDRAHR